MTTKPVEIGYNEMKDMSKHELLAILSVVTYLLEWAE